MGGAPMKAPHGFIIGNSFLGWAAQRVGITDKIRAFLWIIHKHRVSVAIVATIQPWPTVKGRDRRAAAAKKAAD
jgi:hypothetical protein